jgi:hypothetical protein
LDRSSPSIKKNLGLIIVGSDATTLPIGMNAAFGGVPSGGFGNYSFHRKKITIKPEKKKIKKGAKGCSPRGASIPGERR